MLKVLKSCGAYVDVWNIFDLKSLGPRFQYIGIAAFDIFVGSGLEDLPFWSRERANTRSKCAWDRLEPAGYQL